MTARRTPSLLLVALVLVVLVAHVSRYWPFVSDDAFISLRYAERLLDGRGLTWSDDQRVEGYSNLLWVLLTAGLGLGMDLLTAARVLGALSGAATIVALFWAFSGPEGEAGASRAGAALTAGLGLALSGSMAVWSIGGLEQPLLVALLAWALALLSRGAEGARILGPGALLACVCLTRPDGPLLAGMVGLGVLAAGGGTRESWRKVAMLAVLPALAVLGQLAFRVGYYGDYVPNTAHAKVALSAERLQGGLAYVGGWALAHLPLLGLAALAVGTAARDRSLRARLWLVAPASLVWTAYIIVVGGDIFPAWRQMLPALLGLCWMAGEGAMVLASWRGPRTATALVSALLALLLGLQLRQADNQRAIDERWEWDGLAIGDTLRRAFTEQQPLVGMQAAGALPYASKLPAHDILGLNDQYLAAHPPAGMGAGLPGHELGDAAYTLSLNPDILGFCTLVSKAELCFPSGQQFAKNERFKDEYLRVFVQGTDPVSTVGKLWFWRESPKVGVRRTPGRVEVPGWLLASAPDAPAALNAEDRLGLALAEGAEGSLSGLRLGPGRWLATVQGEGPVSLSLEPQEAVRVGAPAEGGLPVEVGAGSDGAEPPPLTLRLRASPPGAFVEQVVFRRAPEG